MYSERDMQVARVKIAEWQREADHIRLAELARRERLAQEGGSSRKVPVLVSAGLKGIGATLIRAGAWLDARYNSPQFHAACDEA